MMSDVKKMKSAKPELELVVKTVQHPDPERALNSLAKLIVKQYENRTHAS